MDIETDDALVGIRSSALRMGRHVRAGVGAFYGVALILWAGAIWLSRPDLLALLALVPLADRQVRRRRPEPAWDEG